MTTTPFQGKFIAGTCYDPPSHQILSLYMFTQYEDMKGNAKRRNEGGLGVISHPKSPAVSPFDTAHTASYSTLIETMRLSCSVFEL